MNAPTTLIEENFKLCDSMSTIVRIKLTAQESLESQDFSAVKNVFVIVIIQRCGGPPGMLALPGAYIARPGRCRRYVAAGRCPAPQDAGTKREL